MADMVDTDAFQRSYDRNLGYARFWLGVGIAVLSLLFTFGYDLIFGDTRPPAAAAATPAMTAWLALAAVFTLALICFIMAAYFRRLYQEDNAALVRIARNKRNHQPHQEEVTQ